ncbi:MAG: DNA-binding protein WhiA [Anaeroplasmataceae bacterium]
MSFSHEIKDELCQLPLGDSFTQMCELEALIRLSSEVLISIGNMSISFQTSNASIGRRFLTLLKNYVKCDVTLITKKVNKLNQNNIYYINVDSVADILMDEFSLLTESKNKDDILSSFESRSAFLRGAFLAKGSVNSPKKSDYHLEIYTTSETDAVFIQIVMNSFDLNAKLTKRRDSLVIYIKEIQAIKDFLRIIGVSKGVFKIEENQIEREVRANIKRQINIDEANDQKTLNAAMEQIRYIRYLEYNYPLEELDGKILLIMKVRKQNPEASLNELIEILHSKYNENITKSGLNHRFRKIKELAQKLEEQINEK